MSDFQKFSKIITAQFMMMAQHELYKLDIEGDDVYNVYLGSFPKGTNELYRQRTEHDCSCCRTFIKNIGNVVAVIDGKAVSVWDATGIEYPYNEVAKFLSQTLQEHSIIGLFRTREKQYGNEYTNEMNNGEVIRWNHLNATIPVQFRNDSLDEIIGKHRTLAAVFKRGLDELKMDDLRIIRSLIQEKMLYRGDEHLRAVEGFIKLKTEYAALTSEKLQKQFAMTNTMNPFSGFRNTVIGTLAVDLSDGVSLEHAVKAFETKVAPANYKRPTALVTQRQKDDAYKAIVDLGLEDSLARRFANMGDITINNVLWADGKAQKAMKGGLAALMDSIDTNVTVDTSKAVDIGIEDFIANILPKAKNMEMLVQNKHLSNFMSITAPVHPSNGDLFKWKNNFAWSYDGNIADSSLRQKVANLGGRVDGVLRFSHTWNYAERNASLMDLHVFMPGSSPHKDGNHDQYPSGQRVGWNNRNDGYSGGTQDVDYTDAAPEGYVPVENITFPTMSRLKDGKYTFKIHNWQLRNPTKGGFKAEIEFDGQIFEYEHKKPLGQKEWVTLAEVTLDKGVFSIVHKHQVGEASQKKWGLTTGTPVPVDTFMLSPNYWDGNAVGNKHYMFILRGCKNPDATRGIYNEFLHSALEQHRKVFEILGEKTQCPPTDDQLSGMGFSSTKRDNVLVTVTGDKGRKTYNITF